MAARPVGELLASLTFSRHVLCATASFIVQWQNGPRSLSYPIESWPASQEFKRELPAEEVRVKPSILVNVIATGQNKSDVP